MKGTGYDGMEQRSFVPVYLLQESLSCPGKKSRGFSATMSIALRKECLGEVSGNPYSIQFSRYHMHLLFGADKSGHSRAQAAIALPLPTIRRGLRRPRAQFCHQSF